MPNADGMDVVSAVHSVDPDIPVILMTGYGDISTAVSAMKQGVYDFIEKPLDVERLLEILKRAVEKRSLNLNLRSVQRVLESQTDINARLIGQCPAMQSLKQSLLAQAPLDIPIMIYGETGAGKEMVARCLHDFSQRKDKPFVALNCAAIPETLAEAELFGHVEGAFTDAKGARDGKLVHANGGTLFLDEVESLPLAIQAKLLRALSDNKVTPVGSNREIDFDVRVISATKDDLRNNEDFRQDLFFRLQVMELRIPPLRERGNDILSLFEHFVIQQCAQFNIEYRPSKKHVRDALLEYPWPGNVRELINVATRYAINHCANIYAALEVAQDAPIGEVDSSLKDQVQRYEEKILREKLQEYQGSVSKVLDDLKLQRRTFNLKCNRYNIIASDYKNVS
jgi:two-component system C4-dicarboxylate transport response regulator DctD